MFNIDFNFYGFFIILSLIIGLIFICDNAKELKFTKEDIIFLVVYLLVGMIVGAKYYDYFVNIDNYKSFNFFALGLSSYGAVIGFIIMLFIYSKQFKKDFITMLKLIIPSLPLIYALSKIACFISGCCYGIEYDGIFSVTYNYSNSAPNGISLFPIQIVETVVFLLIFIFFYIKRNKIEDKKYIGYMFIVCGFFKFILDFLRHVHVSEIISTNQVFSLVFIVIGIIFIFYKKK